MMLRLAPLLPLVLYLGFCVALAARPNDDSDTFRMIVSGVGSFLIYFYVGLAIAALFPLSPGRRLVGAIAVPVVLFLVLATADLVDHSPAPSGGFISLNFNYKTFWILPGIFLTRSMQGRL